MDSNGSRNDTPPRRPTLLAVIAFGTLLFVSIGLTGFLIQLSVSDPSVDGIGWSRLFIEPPEAEGGVPWPGWDVIREVARRDLKYQLDGGWLLLELEVGYWLNKFKMIGSLLLAPVIIAASLGLLLGKTWGRTATYCYVALWVPDKAFYVWLLGPPGLLHLFGAIAWGGLLIFLLHRPSWKAWIEREKSCTPSAKPRHAPTPASSGVAQAQEIHGPESPPASTPPASHAALVADKPRGVPVGIGGLEWRIPAFLIGSAWMSASALLFLRARSFCPEGLVAAFRNRTSSFEKGVWWPIFWALICATIAMPCLVLAARGLHLGRKTPKSPAQHAPSRPTSEESHPRREDGEELEDNWS